MDRRSYQSKFEERLLERWKKPIDLLELLLAVCLEAGAELNDEYRPEASRSNDYVFHVLTGLHARGCQIACEILALLKSGLADGAHARWRTLHEIAVISYFTKDHGQDVAKRYLEYGIVETFEDAREYQKHCREIGYEPFTDKEMKVIQERYDSVIGVYGKEFGEHYGWIPRKILSTRNFAEIEKSQKFDRLRPYYKWACHGVHSGPKSISTKLGLMKTAYQNPVLLADPSNFGLADPGQSAAISLCQITVCLLSTKPTIERAAEMMAIERLTEEISSVFCDVQKEIEREEEIRK